jgi:hypothetical protein
MVSLPFSRIRTAHDVAVCRWEPVASSLFWTLALLGRHIYVGFALADVDRGTLNDAFAWTHDGARLPWPRPNH